MVIDLAVLVPLGLAYVTAPWRVDAGEDVSCMGWLQASGGRSDAWLPAVGVALLVIAAIVPVALGGVLGRAAPALLGPSYARRLEQLEHETFRLVERTRIARELHDSIGHRLSVVVLQSAAARRQLGADGPATARRAGSREPGGVPHRAGGAHDYAASLGRPCRRPRARPAIGSGRFWRMEAHLPLPQRSGQPT